MDEPDRASLAAKELRSGTDFALAEWAAPPAEGGGRELIAPLHRHLHDDEAWYVVDGALGFEFDGREFELSAGGAAMAVAGVAHTYWNASRGETRYVIVTTPRIRELIAALHDPGLRQGRTTEEVFAAYDSELL